MYPQVLLLCSEIVFQALCLGLCVTYWSWCLCWLFHIFCFPRILLGFVSTAGCFRLRPMWALPQRPLVQGIHEFSDCRLLDLSDPKSCEVSGEDIKYHFGVDLEVRKRYCIRVASFMLQTLKYVVEGSCDYSFIWCFELSNHSMSLTRSSLPIRQYSTIKSLHNTIDHRFGYDLIHWSLWYIRWKQVIKWECLLIKTASINYMCLL